MSTSSIRRDFYGVILGRSAAETRGPSELKTGDSWVLGSHSVRPRMTSETRMDNLSC